MSNRHITNRELLLEQMCQMDYYSVRVTIGVTRVGTNYCYYSQIDWNKLLLLLDTIVQLLEQLCQIVK